MYDRLTAPGGPEKMTEFYIGLQPWGTPEQVFEKVRTFCDLVGGDSYIGVFRYGGMPPAEAEKSMRLFAKEVMPELQKIGPAIERLEHIRGMMRRLVGADSLRSDIIGSRSARRCTAAPHSRRRRPTPRGRRCRRLRPGGRGRRRRSRRGHRVAAGVRTSTNQSPHVLDVLRRGGLDGPPPGVGRAPRTRPGCRWGTVSRATSPRCAMRVRWCDSRLFSHWVACPSSNTRWRPPGASDSCTSTS